MSSKTVTFRFPQEVIEVIEAQSRASGRNRTAVVMDALAQFYGFSLSNPTPNAIEELQQQIQRLSSQVADLSEQLTKTRRNLDGDYSNLTVTEAIGQFHRTRKTAISLQEETALGFEVTEDVIPEEQQQLIIQLEHQARTLDQILSANPDLIFVQDRRRRFTYINPAGERLLGFERSYFLGKTFQELGFPVFENVFIAQYESVFTTGRMICNEINIPTIREVRTYEYILSPIHGTNGGIDAVVCTARDITERRQTETIIRESEEKYRNLFETANDSIFIADTAAQCFLNVNRNAARRLGYTRQELLQLTVEDVNLPIADDYKESINQELQVSGSVIFEHWHRHKNGRQIPVEASCRMIEYEGKLAIQSFIRDISDRKKIEERLRLLEAVVLNMDDAIVIAEVVLNDPEPRIVYVNSSFVQVSGYSSDELIGQTLHCLEATKTDRAQDQLRTALTQKQVGRFQLISRCKDGSELLSETTVWPIMNEQDRQTHWILVQRNIINAI